MPEFVQATSSRQVVPLPKKPVLHTQAAAVPSPTHVAFGSPVPVQATVGVGVGVTVGVAVGVVVSGVLSQAAMPRARAIANTTKQDLLSMSFSP
jgi:hypothetical protein